LRASSQRGPIGPPSKDRHALSWGEKEKSACAMATEGRGGIPRWLNKGDGRRDWWGPPRASSEYRERRSTTGGRHSLPSRTPRYAPHQSDNAPRGSRGGSTAAAAGVGSLECKREGGGTLAKEGGKGSARNALKKKGGAARLRVLSTSPRRNSSLSRSHANANRGRSAIVS